ncbi:MAG: VWA domain-containing protein [Proteobacteria bacterium]|nr:VWA domain-containing protein [Pseudomonadota bacterium]
MIDPRSITLAWPLMLWLLAVLPLAAALYFYLLARRRRSTLPYARLVGAGESQSAFKRNVPVVLLLLGLTSLLFAITRPSAVVMLPSRVETIILAIDASGSMRATDVKPDRISAAQSAAKTFIDDQPGHVRIGVVSVAGAAAVVQPPTDSREELEQAIDRFQLQRGTALGSGLIIALATLLPQGTIDVEKLINPRDGPNPNAPAGRELGGGPAARPGTAAKAGPAAPAAPGSNRAAAIVLLSDGASNIGPDPLKMAQVAADQGVRVFTVGVGTTEGATLTLNGWSMRVRLDEDTLKKIASITGGEYFRAGTAPDLKKIYKTLSAQLAFEKHQSTEVTALFVALGAALAMLGALLSLLWFNRIF